MLPVEAHFNAAVAKLIIPNVAGSLWKGPGRFGLVCAKSHNDKEVVDPLMCGRNLTAGQRANPIQPWLD